MQLAPEIRRSQQITTNACMYVYIYICIYACIYIYIYMYIYISACTKQYDESSRHYNKDLKIRIYIYVCVCVYVCMYTHTHTHTYIYIYIYIYIYVYIYIYICIYKICKYHYVKKDDDCETNVKACISRLYV